MIGTLLRLIALRQRAALRHFFRGLKSPRRLIPLLLTLALIAIMFWTGLHARGQPGSRPAFTREPLALLAAMIFVMSVTTGFLNQGPSFALADVDFLFPAPFSPRLLLVWRLFHLYPLTLVGPGILFATLGIRLERPLRFLVAMLLLQVTALHLQLFISVLLTRVEAKFAEKVRGVARRVVTLLALAGLMAFALVVVKQGGPTRMIAPIADAPLTRLILFPAAACVDFVYAESPRMSGFALLRLLLGVGGSLLLLFLPDINYLEDSVVTTARVGRLLARRRRGEMTADAEGVKARSGVIPASRLLFGASGAIVWKNLIILSRSLRVVIPSLLVGSVVILPAIFALKRGDGISGDAAFIPILMISLFTSNSFGFDLRREVERLDVLRGLPLAPASIVLAELVVPWALCVLVQEGLVAALNWISPEQGYTFGLIALALPLSTFLLVTIDNLSVFLFPPRGGTGGMRSSFGASSAAQLVRGIIWAAAHGPAIAAGFFAYSLTEGDLFWVAATAAGAQLLICLLAFVLLVKAYENREIAGFE